jgi:anhydro-N-acetylmuramic acid kinase
VLRERAVAGIMSGTSADGIDVAIVRLAMDHPPQLLGGHTSSFDPDLQVRVIATAEPGGGSAEEIARLDFALAAAYADAIRAASSAALLDMEAIDLIGCHGQTIAHLPRACPPATLQAGSGPALAALTGIPVVFDFRAADVALGGQGAPLIPYVDWLLFRDHARDRPLGVLNLGGIANITLLPRGVDDPAQVIAFDTGPGNMVMDRLAREVLGEPFDRAGALAARGTVDELLLHDLLEHQYFSLPLPKSAGREEFGAAFVARVRGLARERGLEAADLMATAAALTARSVALSLDRVALGARPARLLLGGGGAHNATLRSMLAAAMPHTAIMAHEDFGLSGDLKEALGFALLADAAVRGVSAALPTVTGAREAYVLGAIAPGRAPRVWPDWIGQP